MPKAVRHCQSSKELRYVRREARARVSWDRGYRFKKSAPGIRRDNGVFLSYNYRERAVEGLQSAGGLIAILEKDSGGDERIVLAGYRDERIVRRDQDQARYEFGPSPGGLAGDAAAQRFAEKNYRPLPNRSIASVAAATRFSSVGVPGRAP